MIQTAEGALSEVHDILQRMRELATQAANDTNYTADREAIGKELTELGKEITRIKDTTEFNEQKLLDGSSAGSAGTVTLQVGANEGQKMELNFTTAGIDLTDVETNVGALTDADVTDYTAATELITTINDEIKSV